MSRRPDPFNQSALEEALRALGCPDSFIASTVSNYRLFVPLLFARLDEETIMRAVCEARYELGLGEQQSAWRSALRYLSDWAEQELDAYKVRRNIALQTSLEESDECHQPRLL